MSILEPFLSPRQTIDPLSRRPSTVESAGPREPTYHLHWRCSPCPAPPPRVWLLSNLCWWVTHVLSGIWRWQNWFVISGCHCWTPKISGEIRGAQFASIQCALFSNVTWIFFCISQCSSSCTFLLKKQNHCFPSGKSCRITYTYFVFNTLC